MRTGISLLEVLISMFVLAVGLLGLASMVPVGQFQVSQATHADFASSVGRGEAFKHIKVQDMLDEASWVYYTAGAYQPYMPTSSAFVNPSNPIDTAFVIDGLALATYATDTDYQFFPYTSTTMPWPSTSVPRVDRISIKDLAVNNNNIAVETADRIFRGLDDKIFEIPTDTTRRPMLMNSIRPYTDSNGNGVYNTGEPFNDLNGNGTWDAGQSAQLQSQGDYSWMVMISPALWWDTTAVDGTAPNQAVPIFVDGLGTTTVLVLHKRDLADTALPPSERGVWADVQSVGAGSLDVQLRDTTSTIFEDAKRFLRVRHNQWIMLSADTRGNSSGYV